MLSIPIIFDDRIPELMHIAVERHQKQIEEGASLLNKIDDVLLEELGISQNLELPNTLESRMFLRKFSEVNGNRIDPASHQEKRRYLETAIRSSKYPIQSLRHIVSSEKKLVNEIEEGSTYIGLENIDGRGGEFIATAEKESVSTAIQFKPGQILFPKLRPYLNKTHLATFKGICSTEFHVFTPHSLNSEYLASFLRSRAIVGITSLLMTGNTLPRLQLSDIEKLPIPLPPREVQERIVAKIQDMKTQARKLYADASTQLETAKLEIENLILGHGVSE